jgi:nicotinate-nucleotide adenylyltransferase
MLSSQYRTGGLGQQAKNLNMRIGIFGGTFDPVHYGHLLLAESCREQRSLDQVWFLPAAVSPHKQHCTPSHAQARIEMLELAVGGHESFSVSRYEIDRGGVNYTVETITHFREQHPGDELFFLLGADSLRDLPTWREPRRLAELCTIVAVCRPGSELDFTTLESVIDPSRLQVMRQSVVDMPLIGLSASDIRRRVAGGLSIRYQTPRAVEKYVETAGLYRS